MDFDDRRVGSHLLGFYAVDIDNATKAYTGSSKTNIIWAYRSSLFPEISKWVGIAHEVGINPFQPGIDLWMLGIIPSFDGTTWRLHRGSQLDIFYEITQLKLEKLNSLENS